MSQTIYNDSFSSISDLFRDGPLFTAPLDIETTNYPRVALTPFLGPVASGTPGYQYGLVQSVESPLPLVVSGHGLRSDEHPQGLNLTGPYPVMDNFNYPPPAPFTNVGVDDQPHPFTGRAEHRGNQTHDGRHHIPAGPGPLRREYRDYAPMTPELTDDDHLGHVPLLDNGVGPTYSRMSDDEGLKHLVSQYLNNPGSYVNDFHVSRGLSGGRKISIILEIDD